MKNYIESIKNDFILYMIQATDSKLHDANNFLVNTLVLCNAGALVAVLGFIGSILSGNINNHIPKFIIVSGITFALNLLLTIVMLLLKYNDAIYESNSLTKLLYEIKLNDKIDKKLADEILSSSRKSNSLLKRYLSIVIVLLLIGISCGFLGILLK